ncbi:hypothetical protein [Stenotrophomonas maltophilia]|uniref:hypothetical protein n=1 Tax=Stenotrophomonas maltophilia TaxID=40324 RepID=UPI0021AC7D21|nr:hypothetical protein [Stenotrophomonas maltophilia]
MKGHPAPRRLRLALLDDHEIVRRGTVLHLSQDARFRIIASHGHSDAFIQRCNRRGWMSPSSI